MVHVRQLTIRLDEPLDKKFDEIKGALGLKNDAEVIRYLVRHYKIESPDDAGTFDESEWSNEEKEVEKRF